MLEFMRINPDAAKVLEEMRKMLAKQFGITLIDNRVYLRWDSKDNGDQEVSMVITDVKTGAEHEEEMEKYEVQQIRLRYLKDRVKREKGKFDLDAAIWYLETGETPQ